jgi:hypothetical protein
MRTAKAQQQQQQQQQQQREGGIVPMAALVH